MNAQEHAAAHAALQKLRKPIRNANVRHKESLSVLEKFAVKITDYVGGKLL